MARPINTTSQDNPSSPTEHDPSSASSKPLPDPATSQVHHRRPGTSGTLAALQTTRRQASEKFRQADRAERTYRATKWSAAARANRAEAGDHFRQSRQHFTLGCRLLVEAVRGWPYVLRERREARRVKAEEAKRKKVLEMKKRLDEKLGEAKDEDREGKKDVEGEKGAKTV
ncbi:hypothetical protein B0J18DRAFT_406797 [Chaetomium sp. MPI-SDFR-AT-0129]|uniref:Uncharacterized protein n=1 Tax=Dichotomopilus funicola TaxID=1934379 RepID=A0AAN6ZRQ5_9PEZI|nr:hypothetical protein B0J18DRAFT_406797 [Chaetomium sp. MPI-SDFR-AT-0129]KAK4146721.1 hypothetical protein C8A04DRAFT_25289 [Dichotomopilus funicola]